MNIGRRVRQGLLIFLGSFFLPVLSLYAQDARLYGVSKGRIVFESVAPKELISARSEEMAGILDAEKKTFSFRIPINSFRGFNSSLQREHFNENYMESRQFPEASFTGKIMEDLDFSKPGKYTVRAKGRLTIHGIMAERLIPVLIEVKPDGSFSATSDFMVALNDHQIKKPRLVYQKLSSEIKVHVDALLEPRSQP